MKKVNLLVAFCVVFIYSTQAQNVKKHEPRKNVYREYLHNVQMRNDSLVLYNAGDKAWDILREFEDSGYVTKIQKAKFDSLFTNKSFKHAYHRLDSNNKQPPMYVSVDSTLWKVRVQGESKKRFITAPHYKWPIMSYGLKPLGWVNVQGRAIFYYSVKDKEALLEVLAPYHPVRIGVSENYTITRFEENKYFSGWHGHILYKRNNELDMEPYFLLDEQDY